MSSGDSLAGSSVDRVVQRMENDDLLIDSSIWTKAEEGILKDSLKPYRETPSGEKGDFIKYKVVKRIKALELKKHPEGAIKHGGSMYKMWKAKKKRIYRYMMNHGSVPRGIKLPGLNRKFTFDSVLREFRRADILLEAKRLAGGPECTGTKWIGYYQQAKLTVGKHLEPEEKEIIEETVVKWNKGYVPPEVQQRMAKRQSKKILREMNRRNFLAMGMRSVTMECHLAEDGTMRYSLTDTEGLKLDDPRIPAFRTFDPDAVRDMEAAYKRYVKHIYDLLKDPDAVPPAAEVLPEVNLEYYPGGLPKVPNLVVNKNSTETNKIQQEVIRVYLQKHHELALGRKARLLYKPISEDLSKFLAPGSWPPEVPFKETSRYDSGETNAILRHWRTRQLEGEIPFKFDWVPVGGSSVPENYPKDIFTFVQPPVAAAAPHMHSFPKSRKLKKSTLMGWDETDSDSEAHNSDRDDLPQATDSPRDEDSVRPSTPPESQVDTESLAGDSTRGMSEVRSSSPLKRIFTRGRGKGTAIATKTLNEGDSTKSAAEGSDDQAGGVNISPTKRARRPTAAHTRKTAKAKVTAPPAAQQPSTRPTRKKPAAPPKATSSKKGGKAKK